MCVYVFIFVCAHADIVCTHVCVCAFICIRTYDCEYFLCVCRCLFSGGGGGSHSVWVDEEAGEGAVLVCVPSVDLPPVQLHTHLIAHVQMQDHTVGGVVVILISILSDGAGSYLSPTGDTRIDN